MHKKVKQMSFSVALIILESITLFKTKIILKNTLNMCKASRIAKSAIVNKNECKYLKVKLTKNPLNALTTCNG